MKNEEAPSPPPNDKLDALRRRLDGISLSVIRAAERSDDLFSDQPPPDPFTDQPPPDPFTDQPPPDPFTDQPPPDPFSDQPPLGG
jgi:hypothetical protein